MIPIKLQLKNFLSYGSTLQTVHFGDYPLICLSGKNGHGKSALLDAITWALWGQARKTNTTSKADRGLVRLGQTHMMVILEFLSHTQRYRIRRELSLSHGKSYATLEFGIFDARKNDFIPLTDKTIRSTQEKIERTIHLNFESFINSAFLRQGQSNEFSQKIPKERKEILAHILGLHHYEQIKKKAHEKVRETMQQFATVQALQEERTRILQTKDQLFTKLTVTRDDLNKLQHQQKLLAKALHEHQEKRNTLLHCKKQLEIITLQIQQLCEKEQEMQQMLLGTWSIWRSIHKQYITYSIVPHIEREKVRVLTEIQHHQQALHTYLLYKDQELIVRQELEQLKHTLITAHRDKLQQEKITLEHLVASKNNASEQLSRLTAEYARQTEELNNSYSTLEKVATKLNKIHTEISLYETEQKVFEKRKEYYHRYVTQGKQAQQELAQLQHKKTFIHDDNAPSCPLCEQTLSASRKRFLKQKFMVQQNYVQNRVHRLTTIVHNLKNVLMKQNDDLQVGKKKQEQYTADTVRHQELTKICQKLSRTLQATQEQIQTYQATLLDLDQKINKQKQIIETKTTEQQKIIENTLGAHPAQQKLLDIQYALINSKQSQEQLNKSYDMLKHLEEIHKQQEHLLQEYAQQSHRKEIVRQLCMQLRVIKKEKDKLTKQCVPYQQDLKLESMFLQEEQKLFEQQSALSIEKEEILQQCGRLEQEKEHLLNVEKEYEAQKAILAALQQTITDYQVIAMATGKDGLQALLIEDIIPEIEQEANNLLVKLTDNQAQIMIESLRDLHNGSTKETLDIKVSDSMGIRPYEMFSGGEAFRIDFALRIAISKLLARRAGTSLQILIIDEGFGSQDEDGLSRIMDAIYKIQDDFYKIIIVSHLTAMKDQFPIHFMIHKGPNGSEITVIEQA